MIINNYFRCAASLAATLWTCQASADYNRQYIHVVGSSTLFPFARAVGEKFSKTKKQPLPRLESTGTGGGIKLFCGGVGGDHPDIVNSSRALKPKERDECRTAGVSDIIEIKVGYDGLVLAQSKQAPALALARKDVRQALAKWVLDSSGKLVLNPNKTWKQINSAWPDARIEVLGPQPVSGTYDALVELLSDGQCTGAPWVVAGKTDPSPDMLRKCREIRDDGAYLQSSSDEGWAARLESSPSKVAVADFSAFGKAGAKLRAIPIDNVEPSVSSIESQSYAGTRPLYMYAKGANIGRIPGLRDYLSMVGSEASLGEKGFVKPLGLVVLPPDQVKTVVADVRAATGLAPASESAAGGSKGKKSSRKPAEKKKESAKSNH